jgi:hypothetical protein
MFRAGHPNGVKAMSQHLMHGVRGLNVKRRATPLCFCVSVAPLIFGALAMTAAAAGCGPTESRDMSGARTELNPPKTENFLVKVNAVKPGTPMHAVREDLGKPDEIRDGVIALRPEPGPTETLAKFAPVGTPFEQWIYKRGDSHFHVFFARGARGGDVDWEVLTVRSTPKAEVY